MSPLRQQDRSLWDAWSARKRYDRPGLELYYQIRARNLEWLAERSRALLPAGVAPRLLKTDLWNEAKKAERFFLDAPGEKVGVEYSAQVCRMARRRHPDSFGAVNGSVEQLPFRSESFDLIWDISTIDHCDAPEQTVVEYHRCLKRGGVLLLIVENPFCLSFPATKLQSYVGLHVPFRAPPPWRVIRWCRDAGLQVVDTFKTNLHLPATLVYYLERRDRVEAINRGRHPLWSLCKKYFVALCVKP